MADQNNSEWEELKQSVVGYFFYVACVVAVCAVIIVGVRVSNTTSYATNNKYEPSSGLTRDEKKSDLWKDVQRTVGRLKIRLEYDHDPANGSNAADVLSELQGLSTAGQPERVKAEHARLVKELTEYAPLIDELIAIMAVRTAQYEASNGVALNIMINKGDTMQNVLQMMNQRHENAKRLHTDLMAINTRKCPPHIQALMADFIQSLVNLEATIAISYDLMQQYSQFKSDATSFDAFFKSFVGGMVGDFSTPVNAIKAHSQFMEEGGNMDQKHAAALADYNTKLNRYTTVSDKYVTDYINELKAKYPHAFNQ
jgi:hypothetical protein